MMPAIGVDVGGTKILAAVVDERGTVLARQQRPTPRQDAPGAGEAAIREIAALVASLAAVHEVRGVGIGVAGRVDPDRRRVLTAANIGWQGQDVAHAVEAATGLDTVVENDANAAAWGEFRFGAAAGFEDVVMITVGTGIGGGLVLGGALRRGFRGGAGEVGHMTFEVDGRPCGCGRHGCWEQYASGRALVREAVALGLLASEDPPRPVASGDDAVLGRDVLSAAEGGNAAALAAFDRVGIALGRGLADLAEALDPQAFVIGGGVSEAGGHLLGPARRTLERELADWAPEAKPAVLVARLGNSAGVVGVADLLGSPT
ncbi:MAG TPA: ROK family glucokinase [Candidatus Nanopelagicales bacterium]|nr:ROK family glucokinase [Candidatus Nanopelagicales bacterium]